MIYHNELILFHRKESSSLNNTYRFFIKDVFSGQNIFVGLVLIDVIHRIDASILNDQLRRWYHVKVSYLHFEYSTDTRLVADQ